MLRRAADAQLLSLFAGKRVHALLCYCCGCGSRMSIPDVRKVHCKPSRGWERDITAAHPST
eukprot:1155970-Pelagomonas_calceolata.AAC.3